MGKIVFDKFFNLRKEKGLTTVKIRENNIIPQSTLQKMRENKCITTDSIAALCEALDCQPEDIMEYVKD